MTTFPVNTLAGIIWENKLIDTIWQKFDRRKKNGPHLRLRGCLDQTLPGVSGVRNDKSKIKVPLLQTSTFEQHLLLYPELFHWLYRWEVDLPESKGLSMTQSYRGLLCSPGHGSALEDLLWHPGLVLLIRDAEVLITLWHKHYIFPCCPQIPSFLLTCHRILPVSASRRFIQLTRNPDKMSSAFAGIL